MDPKIVVEVPDSADWLARGLAIFGALIALASLAWQLVQWRLSGARVRVEDAHFGIAATDPEPTEVVGFHVRNVGRAAATVEAWGFQTAELKDVVFPKQPPQWNNPAIPHKIDPGYSATWTIPLAWIREVLGKEKLSQLRPHVRLGTGEDIQAKRSFTPPDA